MNRWVKGAIAAPKPGETMAGIDESRTHPSLTPTATGTLVSLMRSLRGWGSRLLALVFLEGKKAGISFAFMAGFSIAAGILLVTGWLALVACAIVSLVQQEIVGWPFALIIAALLSFVGAGGLVLLTIQRSKNLLFPASRRQLGLAPEDERLPRE